jgi:multidrug transporter EmrE-like cation transporter
MKMNDLAISWGLVVLSAVFDSYAAYVVKHKFNLQGEIDWSSIRSVIDYLWVFVKSPLLLTAVVTFVAAPALWFVALNRLDLSIAYPVLVSLHLLLVMFVGALLLGESFHPNKIIGTLLIFLSLYFFHKSPTKSEENENIPGSIAR